MHKFLIALLIILGAADAVPQTPSAQPTPPVASPSSPVIINGTPDEIELVDQAVRRFAEHGMQLPAVEITFSDNREACGGFRGLYLPGTIPAHDPVDQITICDEWPVYLYHELAHAWETHSVTDATRAELLDHWHLISWSDQDEDWDARGIEQAAKAISYTLAFDELPEGMNVRRYVCAFELLTGTRLPIEVPVACDADTDIADAPAVDPVSAEAGTEKDPAADPRLARTTAAVSPDTTTERPWSWEHDGPGSNSLDAPWLTATDAP